MAISFPHINRVLYTDGTFSIVTVPDLQLFMNRALDIIRFLVLSYTIVNILLLVQMIPLEHIIYFLTKAMGLGSIFFVSLDKELKDRSRGDSSKNIFTEAKVKVYF